MWPSLFLLAVISLAVLVSLIISYLCYSRAGAGIQSMLSTTGETIKKVKQIQNPEYADGTSSLC
jgi:hypothetical protein